MAIHRLAAIGTLQKGDIVPFHLDDRYLLLVGGEEGPALVDGICPHAGSDLSKGEVVGNRIRCPTHRFFFDLATGGCAVGRREGWGPLPVYGVKEIDGYLCADI